MSSAARRMPESSEAMSSKKTGPATRTCSSTLAVAGIKGRQNVLEKRMITAASKYPRIARAYFESRHKSVDIIKLNGSVELAPLVGLSDVIVDIVETGTTLKENGLEAYDFFMDLSARLICNKVSYKMKQDELKKLISSIEKKG